MSTAPPVPQLRQVVIDSAQSRPVAEFYRQLLGFEYRPGDEPPAAGEPDKAAGEFLVLRDSTGANRIGFEQVPGLPRPTWPEGDVAQMMHLDMTVSSVPELDEQHERALQLGAVLLQDRSDDPDEPLRVYADPAGHPFCIFVA